MTFETVVPGEKLHMNWHLEAMAHALEKVRLGKIKRLIITIPPRSLKSISASVAFPAFLLGQDPSIKIICASYSADLAAKHANDFRAVIKADWYRRIFPATEISREKDTEAELMTTKRGGRYATSVGGTLTGRGGEIFILDDPMKPDEAMSDVARKKVLNWIETTMMSRLNSKKDDAIILVMQRLHEDDPVGIFLEKGGWTHLDLPAIADAPQAIPIGDGRIYSRAEGEVLDPVREPREVLDRLKADMGSMAFSAQYQQRPIPLEGNLIRRAWLKQYEILPDIEANDLVVISWDTAMSEDELADYSVGTVWIVKGDYCYLAEIVRDRFEFPGLRRAVIDLAKRWPRATTLIEDKGSGTSLLQDLRSKNIAVISVRPTQDKVTRLDTTTPMFEAGAVFFPKSATWLDALLIELLAFPYSRHKDQADSISQALNWINSRIRRRAQNDIGMPISILKDGTGYGGIW